MSKKSVAAAALTALLTQIVGFGDAGGYVAKSDDLNALVNAGHVQTGPDGENNTIAVRALPAGIEAAKIAAPAPVAAAAGSAPSFVIAANVPLPEANRGGNKGKSIYPFDGMEIGQSFFIPVSSKTPEPWKSLASTATSATRRYDEKVLENGQPVKETVKVKGKEVTRDKMRHTRVFTMRGPMDGAPWGQPGVQGAGVFRVQPKD